MTHYELLDSKDRCITDGPSVKAIEDKLFKNWQLGNGVIWDDAEWLVTYDDDDNQVSCVAGRPVNDIIMNLNAAVEHNS